MRWRSWVYCMAALAALSISSVLLSGCSGGDPYDDFDSRLVGAWSGSFTVANSDGSIVQHRGTAHIVVAESGDASGTVTWPIDPTALTASLLLGDKVVGSLLDSDGEKRFFSGPFRYANGHLVAEVELSWVDGPMTTKRRLSFDLLPQ